MSENYSYFIVDKNKSGGRRCACVKTCHVISIKTCTPKIVKGTVSKIKCSILEIPFKASDHKGTDYYDVRNFRTCVSKFDFCQKHLIIIHFV